MSARRKDATTDRNVVSDDKQSPTTPSSGSTTPTAASAAAGKRRSLRKPVFLTLLVSLLIGAAWFFFVAPQSTRANVTGWLRQQYNVRFPVFMTPEELAKFNGDDESLPLYLAIAGEIYDVTDGRSHYGKGGGYAGFAGRDATKAFFDLCFTEECLKTAGDLSSLSEKQLREVKSWRDFYFDELRYPFVGYVKTTHANPQPDLDKYKQ